MSRHLLLDTSDRLPEINYSYRVTCATCGAEYDDAEESRFWKHDDADQVQCWAYSECWARAQQEIYRNKIQQQVMPLVKLVAKTVERLRMEGTDYETAEAMATETVEQFQQWLGGEGEAAL